MAKTKKIYIIIVALFIIEPLYSYAYLDPGTGSYIFQLILAVFVGASFTAKIWWRKIRNTLSRLFLKNKSKCET